MVVVMEGGRVIALKLVPGLLNLQKYIYATVHRRFIQLAQLIYRHICLEGWSGGYQCWKYILCSEFRVNNNMLDTVRERDDSFPMFP